MNILAQNTLTYMRMSCKYLTLVLISCLIFTQYACRTPAPSQTNEVQEPFRLKLQQDSGYICADDAFSLLLSNKLIDTIYDSDSKSCISYCYTLDSTATPSSERYYMYWLYEPTDTIGKYYSTANNESIIAAISLGGNTLLLQLTPKGEPVSSYLAGYGRYICCWDSFDDILKRYGDYFGIITCATGLGHCSGHLSLLRDKVEPFEKTILLSAYNAALSEASPGQLLSSTYELRSDSLVVHYKFEEFTNNENGDSNIVSTKKFTVSYVITNKSIESNDTNMLDFVYL